MEETFVVAELLSAARTLHGKAMMKLVLSSSHREKEVPSVRIRTYHGEMIVGQVAGVTGFLGSRDG